MCSFILTRSLKGIARLLPHPCLTPCLTAVPLASPCITTAPLASPCLILASLPTSHVTSTLTLLTVLLHSLLPRPPYFTSASPSLPHTSAGFISASPLFHITLLMPISSVLSLFCLLPPQTHFFPHVTHASRLSVPLPFHTPTFSLFYLTFHTFTVRIFYLIPFLLYDFKSTSCIHSSTYKW